MTDLKSSFEQPPDEKKKQEMKDRDVAQLGIDPNDPELKELLVLKRIRDALARKKTQDFRDKFKKEHPTLVQLQEKMKSKKAELAKMQSVRPLPDNIRDWKKQAPVENKPEASPQAPKAVEKTGVVARETKTREPAKPKSTPKSEPLKPVVAVNGRWLF
jgi:hypothetical protein